MTEEEKKALETENKDMKALSEDELEGVAGGWWDSPDDIGKPTQPQGSKESNWDIF